MGRRYSSTPWSINSVKPRNFLLCHSPLHSFLPSFQSPSLAPFLPLFPLHPGTRQTLCDAITAESGAGTECHCTVRVSRVPASRTGLYLPTPPTNKGLTAAPSTGALGWPGLLSSRTHASVPSSISTHNEFTFTGIYSLHWEAGTAIAVQNIPQTQGEAVGYFCSLPCVTVPQQSKGSFTLMQTLLGIYHCLNYLFLNSIREQATPPPLKVWSLAASLKTQKMGNYFGFCRLWIANPND